MKHRDLIDRIEDAANDARYALIEGDEAGALAAAHDLNIAATALTRALYAEAAKARACAPLSARETEAWRKVYDPKARACAPL